MCRGPFDRNDVISVKKLIKKKKKISKSSKKRKRDKIGKTLSPKVAALLQGLSEMKDDEQAVVFSQFTSFLNIVQAVLKDRGYATCRIDGTMSQDRRSESQQVFKRGEKRVMLISLRAGGVGLNLTSANHVFMMDMWWNVAAEEQAWDRVYRLGQTKPVRIVRFIVKNSIEEGFLKLQKSKNTIFKGAMRKLKKKDLKRLRNLQVKILFDLEAENGLEDDGLEELEEEEGDSDDSDSDFVVEDADEKVDDDDDDSDSDSDDDDDDVYFDEDEE